MSSGEQGVFHTEELFAWDMDKGRGSTLSIQGLEEFSMGEWEA